MHKVLESLFFSILYKITALKTPWIQRLNKGVLLSIGPRASLVCSTELSEFAHVLTDWCKMIILIVFAILAVRRIALSGTYVVVN